MEGVRSGACRRRGREGEKLVCVILTAVRCQIHVLRSMSLTGAFWGVLAMLGITITLEYVLERVVCADPNNSKNGVLAYCSGDVDVTIPIAWNERTQSAMTLRRCRTCMERTQILWTLIWPRRS